MKRERYFKALEFKDIKGIIYNSAKQYAQNVAFVIKHKKGEDVIRDLELGVKEKEIYSIVGGNGTFPFITLSIYSL